jgi:hypothetical protein
MHNLRSSWMIRSLSFAARRRALTLAVMAGVGLTLIACLAVPGAGVTPTPAPAIAAPTTPPTAVPAATDTVAPATATIAPTAVAPTASALPVLSSDQVIAARQAAWEAFAAYAKTSPFRVKQVTSQAGTVISAITTELVPPDQMHEVVELMGQVGSERYVQGGFVYARYPASGKTAWEKMPTLTLQPYADAFGVMSEGAVLANTDGQVLGVDVIDGESAVIYGYSSALKGVTAPSPNKLWVSQKRGLPLRYAKDLPQGGQFVADYTYDASLTITVPPDVAAVPTATP